MSRPRPVFSRGCEALPTAPQSPRIMHTSRRRWRCKKPLVLGILALFGLMESLAHSAPPRALNTPVSVHWQGVSLRQAVNRLGESQRLCVWLDRRVNPSVEVRFSAKETPLSELLDKLSEQTGTAWAAENDLVYVGPPESVRELRTLLAIARDQAKSLTPSASRRMLAKVEMDVPRLAEPLRLVEQLAKRGGVRVENIDQVPHDVWPAAQLPALSVAEHLAVVLVGFDLQWEPADDGRAIRIVPIERPVVLKKLYDRKVLDQSAAEKLEESAISAGPTDTQVWIATTVEQHEALGGSKPAESPPRPRPGRGGKQVYSLRVQQQPLGPILQQLARQLGKQLDIDPQVTRKMLNQRVSFEVKEADLDELLQAACSPAGLSVEFDDKSIRVKVADEE